MHLMVEKKLYHDSMPLVDREWSGFPLSDEHLRAYLPEKFHQVAFLEDKEGNINCLRLPEFTERTYDKRLPGFFVYRRPDKQA